MTEVILVDEQDNAIGVMEKMAAHRTAMLHRAFSIFIFNDAGEMLLQQRAADKYHSAGLWTNACCSHPAPGEEIAQAALRRLSEEMGFTTAVEKAFDFIYKAPFDNGLTEYEFDHVFTGTYNGVIIPNPEEVSNYAYVNMDVIRQAIKQTPEQYTAWFRIAFPMLETHLAGRP